MEDNRKGKPIPLISGFATPLKNLYKYICI